MLFNPMHYVVDKSFAYSKQNRHKIDYDQIIIQILASITIANDYLLMKTSVNRLGINIFKFSYCTLMIIKI